MKKFLSLCILLFCAICMEGKISMPQMFQSGMVLQRGKPIPVWGTANPQETVTVLWNKKTYTATADDQGRWRVDLPKMKAGGPYVLTVSGEGQEISMTDVLVGDVWLCSGQSNVDVTIERVYPQYVNEIDQFDNDQIRLFRVQNETSTHGVKDDIRAVSRLNSWAVGISLRTNTLYSEMLSLGT